MNIYFISDIHFGVRNSSEEWLDNQINYFENFFIPNVLKDPDDKILIIAGDVFDNRQSINIHIYHNVFLLLQRIKRLFKEIHLIVGNHDIFNKTNNDVNSLNIFSLIPNVYVYKEPEVITVNDKKILLMPWYNGQEHVKIQEFKQDLDYLVLHADINTLQFNAYSKVNNGLEVFYLKDFKYVFNGHIHYNQEQGNIITLGSPYHLTRSDIDNDKYIYVLNAQTNQIRKIINDYSPKFKQFDFFQLIEYNFDEIYREFQNNYVYLYISNDISFETGINYILQDLNVTKNLKIVYYENDKTVQFESNEQFSINDIINEYVENLKYDNNTIQMVKNTLEHYKGVLNYTD